VKKHRIRPLQLTSILIINLNVETFTGMHNVYFRTARSAISFGKIVIIQFDSSFLQGFLNKLSVIFFYRKKSISGYPKKPKMNFKNILKTHNIQVDFLPIYDIKFKIYIFPTIKKVFNLL